MDAKKRYRITSLQLDYETDEYLGKMTQPGGMNEFIRLLIKQEYERRQRQAQEQPQEQAVPA